MPDSAPPLVLLSGSVAEHIDQWGSSWGSLDLLVDEGEGVAMVAGYRNKDGLKLPVLTPWMKGHHLWSHDKRADVALWYRVESELHEMHEPVRRRRAAISTDNFRSHVLSGWTFPPVEGSMLVLTVSGTAERAEWKAWWVNRAQASPGNLHLVDESKSLLDFLKPVWPLEDLVDARVTIVGCGSIGGATAEALVAYGIRNLTLIDPDRLKQHNVIRHRLTSRHLGRHKVRAIKGKLEEDAPGILVEDFPLDVVYDADFVRPLFRESDLVIGTTDGVEPRRVVNHLARRAGVPLVLGCVLEDGAIGEVLRVRVGSGCLLCNRTGLVERGAMNPEPSLDLGYGTGTRHLPMTAIGGDLHMVGALAAKVAISTLLEAKGHREQRLPGEQALVALRPVPDLPAPFDLEEAGKMHWEKGWESRNDCPTCAHP